MDEALYVEYKKHDLLYCGTNGTIKREMKRKQWRIPKGVADFGKRAGA